MSSVAVLVHCFAPMTSGGDFDNKRMSELLPRPDGAVTDADAKDMSMVTTTHTFSLFMFLCSSWVGWTRAYNRLMHTHIVLCTSWERTRLLHKSPLISSIDLPSPHSHRSRHRALLIVPSGPVPPHSTATRPYIEPYKGGYKAQAWLRCRTTPDQATHERTEQAFLTTQAVLLHIPIPEPKSRVSIVPRCGFHSDSGHGHL